MAGFLFDEVTEGEEYGPLEYEITDATLNAYRSAVGNPSAQLVTIAAKDYVRLLATKYSPPTIINAKHSVSFRGTASAGSKVRVTGRLKAKYVKRERQYVVVETSSVDETGHEIAHAETTLLLGRA